MEDLKKPLSPLEIFGYLSATVLILILIVKWDSIWADNRSDEELVTSTIERFESKLQLADGYYQKFNDGLTSIGMGKPIYQVYEESETFIQMHAQHAQSAKDAADQGISKIKNTQTRNDMKKAIDEIYGAYNLRHRFMVTARQSMATGHVNQEQLNADIKYYTSKMTTGWLLLQSLQKQTEKSG